MKGILQDVKAVLFDLDGTLVDSMWMWTDIDIEYLARFGRSFSRELQKTIEGMSFTETAVYFKDHFAIPDSIDQIKADWVSMSIEKYRTQVPLKPHAGEFLKALKRQGIRTGIATSNYREMVDACLGALPVDGLLDVVCTACEVERGKPFPDIYLHVAKKLETPPEKCLVFEDIPAGIRAGKAAGMRVIAVDDDFSKDMEAEKRALSDFFIEDYSVVL